MSDTGGEVIKKQCARIFITSPWHWKLSWQIYINNNSEHLRICERGDVGSTICRALQWRNSFRANTAYKLVGPGV